MRVRMDPSAVAFAGSLGIATALVSGTLPAWRAMRANLAEPLKLEATASRGSGKTKASWALLTGQVAFSCAAAEIVVNERTRSDMARPRFDVNVRFAYILLTCLSDQSQL